jgi:Tol biopolymer transport system component
MPPLPFSAFLSVRTANGGALSPDGRRLAFLLNSSGAAQVFRQDGPGTEPVQLTRFDEIVRWVSWSPDGRWLLFGMDHAGNERTQLYRLSPDGSDVRRLSDTPEAIHGFGGWSPDGRRFAYGANRRCSAYFDVYVMNLETGEDDCVLQRDATMLPHCWSPDGRALLVREEHRSDDHDLHLLDLTTGELRRLTPHEGYARYQTPRLLPDGRRVLTCTDQDRDFLALVTIDLRSGALRALYEPEAEVELCEAPLSGDRVGFLVNRVGYSAAAFGSLACEPLADLRIYPTGGVCQ